MPTGSSTRRADFLPALLPLLLPLALCSVLIGLMFNSTSAAPSETAEAHSRAALAAAETAEETATPTATAPTETPTATATLVPCVSGDVNVDIQNFAFSPARTVICTGDKVTWTNRDDVRHTTTSDNGVWDSGLLRQGQPFERVFTTPGAYTYYCSAHFFMRGVVLVGVSAATSPTATATAQPSTMTPTATLSATATARAAVPTATPTRAAPATPATPTATPTPARVSPTATATATSTATRTATPTNSPTVATPTPTATPGHTHPPTITPAATSALLDAGRIPKYVEPLLVPPAMPRTAELTVDGQAVDYYEIAARQFQQHILPRSLGLRPSTVWGYGAANAPDSFSYPGFTIEARYNRPVRVKWINDLVDSQGGYLPYFLPVDQTLHWANPAGGASGRDNHGMDHTLYSGPVPLVTHLHGAHTTDDSDGYPEAWYLPAAQNIPAGFSRVGTWYDPFKAQFAAREEVDWTPGSSVYQYPNDQAASTLWYHDHTLGVTRANVYAGLAGFYLLRGGPEDSVAGALPGPAPAPNDPPGAPYYELPLLIQDRSFKADGSLYLPDSRAEAQGLAPNQLQIPFMHDPACGGPSDVPPIWSPEFFGNTLVVNGRTWPYADVEARRYRLRLLNGSNARFLILKFNANVPFYQIGAEGGFLPAPVRLDQLVLGPAERADVIVDLTGIAPGITLTLLNLGPDAAFHGGRPGQDFPSADPNTTGQVMQFRVGAPTGPDLSAPPLSLTLPTRTALGPASQNRQVSLNERESQTVFVTEHEGALVLDCASDTPFGPTEAKLGVLNPRGGPSARGWADDITEKPVLNTTEVWEIHNFTMHAHPIHIHQVGFEVVNREVRGTGVTRPPDPWETGLKDTVIAYPSEIVRVKVRFDLPGRYVWHCHLLGHEDNEMMRPIEIVPYRLWAPLIYKGSRSGDE